MLSTLVLTKNFGSPLSEEEAFGVNIQSHTEQYSLSNTTSHGIWRFIPHQGKYILQSEADWDIYETDEWDKSHIPWLVVG